MIPVNPSAYFYHKSLHQRIGPYKTDTHTAQRVLEQDFVALDRDFLFKAVQVAQVKFMDEIWGNFRLIKGTITYNRIKSGVIKQQNRNFARTIIKELPLSKRWQVYYVMATNLCINTIDKLRESITKKEKG